MKRSILAGPPRSAALATVVVTRSPGARSVGRLRAGAITLPCVLGSGGLSRRKREGDGATPIGCFALKGGFFRPDRGPRPPSRLALRPSRTDDGWCDDPASGRYNRAVRLPFSSGHERLWRDDRLYDCGLVLDYNLGRPRKGRGSAIFLHVMAEAGTPTAGCVALRPGDLRRLLPRLSRHCRVVIG